MLVHTPCFYPREGGHDLATDTVEEVRTFIQSIPDWEGGDLLNIKVVALNKSTVSIRVKWLKKMSSGSSFETCEGYIAGKTANSVWKFTNYLVVDCEELEQVWK